MAEDWCDWSESVQGDQGHKGKEDASSNADGKEQSSIQAGKQDSEEDKEATGPITLYITTTPHQAPLYILFEQFLFLSLENRSFHLFRCW